MVFEALYPQLDFTEDTIQRIVGIFDTNAIEIRLAQSEIMALYETACMLEHSCCPNIRMTFDEKYHVSQRLVSLLDGIVIVLGENSNTTCENEEIAYR